MNMDFTAGRPGRKILLFSLPILAGNIFHQLFNVVDGIIVGRYVGEHAIAAVGASAPLYFTVSALFVGLTMGASTLLAAFMGAGDMVSVRKLSETVQKFLMWSAVVLAVLCCVFARPVFSMMDLPDSAMDDAVLYFRIFSVTTFLPAFMFYGMTAILKGAGDSLSPVRYLVAGFVLNIILDVVFVAFLDAGVAGAAAATGLSSVFQWAGLFLHMRRKDGFLKMKLLPWHMGFDGRMFMESFRIGLPIGVQQSLIGAGGVAMFSIVSGYGVYAVAAYAAASRIDMFVSMPASDLASGLSMFISQNAGAGRYDRFGKGLAQCLVYVTVLCAVLSVAVGMFGEEIMGMFVSEDAHGRNTVVGLGAEYLGTVSVFYILFNAMLIFNAVPRGVGATFYPMVITLASLWLARIPLACLFSSLFGLEGVYWAVPAGWAVGIAGAFSYWASGHWKRRADRLGNGYTYVSGAEEMNM